MAIKIALAGNPNSGKTTLFNSLTGSNQFVGNWPGVTVEKKEGKLKGHKDVTITDLPGIYSLSPYTLEEVVARNYLLNEAPDAILNIIDGSNLERNLYLTTQLTELGIPVIMAVNMMDVVSKRGDKIDFNKLGKALGCVAAPISALKGTGIKEIAENAVRAAQEKKASAPVHTFSDSAEGYIDEIAARLYIPEAQKRFYAIKLFERDDKIGSALKNAPDVEDIIKKAESEFDDDPESIITNERYTYITSVIGSCYKKAGKQKLTISDKIDQVVTNRILALPIFAAIMFIVYYLTVSTIGTAATDWANDGLFGDGYHLFGIGSAEYSQAVDEHAAKELWNTPIKAELTETIEAAAKNGAKGADDLLKAIKDEDYGAFKEAYESYSDSVKEHLGIAEDEGGEEKDKTGSSEDSKPKNKYAATLEAVEGVMDNAPDPAEYGVWVPGVPVVVEGFLDSIGAAEWLKSLILDGIVKGVGSVLGFVPQMLVLFILLAFLEACGYMARVAFIMDRIFRRFGLSGKSFIPYLIGTGCGVPAVMASRTIENERDRRMTIMTTTFMPCSAKLPIIALIATALFGGAAWVGPSAYFVGIAAIICSGIILKKTRMFSGDPAPFVMELPPYHMPTPGNILRSMWERSWSFIKKAGTIILLSSIIIWAGSRFGNTGSGFGFSTEMELEDSVLGMIGGAVMWIFAPLGFDNIKATIATVMGLVAKEEVVGVFGVLDFEGMTKLAAYSFLLFNLLCAPCFAAIGAIRREMNSAKWTWFAIGYQCIFAYIVALCVFQLGTLLTGGGFGIFTIVAILLVACFIFLLFRPYKESTRLDVKLQ